ncbi:hypothetical protein BLS_007771 [Venturia inaequalis]|uniref:Rrp15p-domain-containing protein n=1 Tax=Venturia inaequalis TaxID=5025 RepID=A0A8H3U9A1_VENIN|nr:hypothetical protein BLS_007771 [Venturia inaequalis]KAE9966693.1 hypothetical protein EG328_008768 [Venturia inaequalis]
MPSILKRTRADEREPRRPKKKIRKSKKQLEYHSSSSEDEGDDEPTDFKAINLQDSDDELAINTAKNTFIGADSDNDEVEPESDLEEDAAEDSDATGASSDAESDVSGIASTNGTKKKKRNDPEVFATSMSKILGTKLTTTKRSDPVLSRSAAATSISKEVSESRLEAKARQKLRLEKKHKLDKGRVKDVMGLGDEETSTQGIIEAEKKLKKTAQRGVIKLFNAVREAQKRGEDAKREALKEGVVGMDRREEKVSEMSKKGFMELIASGGK